MRLGWNQKRLAEVTGIPQGDISRIERGKIEDIHLSRFVILMRTLSTWTEIFPQNPSRFHYHHGDDMKEASNPWKATWHHPPISETIQR